MLKLSETLRLHFLGWNSESDRVRYHNSPEYFEGVWIGERIPGKPEHPVGLVNIFEVGCCRSHPLLKVLFDPGRTKGELVVRSLLDAGLLVEQCAEWPHDRRHSV